MTDSTKWECNRCGYKSLYKHCLVRHLQRSKPCLPRKSTASIDEQLSELLKEAVVKEKRYECEFCTKRFMSRVGKCKHRKICESRKSISCVDNDVGLMSVLSSMQKELRDLHSKINDKNTPFTITNNITHHNNQKLNVQVNAFGRENTKHLTTQFLDGCVKKTNVGLVELLDRLHFGAGTGGCNANVRITNRKLALAEVNDGEQWRFAKKDQVINQMVDRGQDMLQEHLEEHENRLKEQLSESMWEHVREYFLKMEVRDEEMIQKVLDDVYIMLLNKSRELSYSSRS